MGLSLGKILVETINEMDEERMVNGEIINWLGRVSVDGVDLGGGEDSVDMLRREFTNQIRSEGIDEYGRYISQFYDKPMVFKRNILAFIYENPGCVNDDVLSGFGGNVEKMLKAYKDCWGGYDFGSFLRYEYMDRFLVFMMPGATFFRKLKMRDGGHLICHRAINVVKDRINDLWDGLGIYWTFGDTAFSYDNFFGEDFANGNIYTLTFHAEVPAQSISVGDMLNANAGYFDSEEEVTVKYGSPVVLYGIDVMDYKTKRKWKVPLGRKYICKA